MRSRRLLLVAAMMAAAGGSLRLAARTDVAPAAERLSALPLRIAEWQGRDLGRLDEETNRVLQADNYLWRTYTRGFAPVTLFIAYYASQRSGHTMHSPLNCLPGTGWTWVQRGRQRILTTDREIDVNRNIARKDNDQTLVYYWYQSRGRVVASEYRNKALLVADALARRRSDGALVRITAVNVPGDARFDADATGFIQAAYPILTRYLPE